MGRPRIKHYFFLLVFVMVLVNHIKGINLVTSATQINELEMSLSPEMEQSLCKDLSLTLAKFPKVRLGHLPTPLEPMDRLSEILGGPRLWVKRDDCTGLSSGGNKTRKLEFLMADAQSKGADTIITQGATQSNHARQTTAAAAKLGMECHILLEDRTGSNDNNYILNGNVLLDRLHGASVSKRSGGTDMNLEMQDFADALIEKGKKPYIIPGGGSNPIGALGYVNCLMKNLLSGMRIRASQNAIRLARSNLDYLRQQQREMDWREEMYMRHWIEYYKKYALGVAVLIMFFIGAPLGSIIRKGGIGLPLVISTIAFLIFHILNTTFEKMGREMLMDVELASWLPSIILAPVALWLTYSASTDRALLSGEWFNIISSKLRKGKANA